MGAAPGVSAVDGDAMVKVGAGPKAKSDGKTTVRHEMVSHEIV
jgi:hypothetical protein